MKNFVSIIAIATMAMGMAVASADTFASVDADRMQGMEHHGMHAPDQMPASAAPEQMPAPDQTPAMEHHHHHAVAAEGYARSVVAYQMPEVKLVDANGKAVALADSLDTDEPVMLNFIFTTCTTVCPVMSATFAQVQEKLGRAGGKVRMVSISIDPEHDSPAQLHAYAQRFDAGPQWSMLTGTIEDSIAVQRAFNVYRGDKMNHEPVTFMRNGPDRSWVRIDGFASADELLREYRNLVLD